MNSTIGNTKTKNALSHAANNLIAYDFVKSKGFVNVTEAICCMGCEDYHREFKEFKNQSQIQ